MTRRLRVAAALLAAVGAGGAAAQKSDADRVRDGRGVYQRHCAQCHGPEADGKGIHAQRFNPPPSNLALSKRTDDYRLQIITVGGLNMGRSAVMPEWGLELSAADILAVVMYLRTVSDQAQQRANAGKPGVSAVAVKRASHG